MEERAASDGDLYRLVALIPPELHDRVQAEMRRQRRAWPFKNRSRAVRTLLEEALDARDMTREQVKRMRRKA